MTQEPWPIDAKWPVIGPPKKVAELLLRVEQLDTPALTAYAKEIGFQPPTAQGSERWPIVPEYDGDDQFLCLVWADPDEESDGVIEEDTEGDWPTAQPV